jgi:hypothetical protein
MIKKLNLTVLILTLFVVGISGCASNQLDRKPYDVGQCSVIRQEDASSFEVSKNALIGKRYAFYSKAKMESQPRGPYILRDVGFTKLSDRGSWWQVKFNGNPVDVAETFIETSTGAFENLIIVQSKIFSGSCNLQNLVYQKRLQLN